MEYNGGEDGDGDGVVCGEENGIVVVEGFGGEGDCLVD